MRQERFVQKDFASSFSVAEALEPSTAEIIFSTSKVTVWVLFWPPIWTPCDALIFGNNFTRHEGGIVATRYVRFVPKATCEFLKTH